MPSRQGSLAGLDEEGNAGLDEDLRKMARDVSHKQMAGSKCTSTTRMSMRMRKLRTVTVPCSRIWTNPYLLLVKRSGKAKSPAKSGPVNWPAAEVDGVRQNRYAIDRPEMRDYHRNYLVEAQPKDLQLEEPLQVP